MRFLVYSLTISILFSCASWRKNDTSYLGTKSSEEEIQTDNKLKISLKLKSYTYLENGKPIEKEEIEKANRLTSNSIQGVYEESKLFNIVDVDSPGKDVSVELEVQRSFKSSMTSKVLSALTLYLIPRKTEQEIVYTSRFFDKEGKLIGIVEYKDSVITWRQFFMLFVWPFSNSSETVYESMIQDFTHRAIVEANQDGYFVDLSE